jgi:hypothetical protein
VNSCEEGIDDDLGVVQRMGYWLSNGSLSISAQVDIGRYVEAHTLTREGPSALE